MAGPNPNYVPKFPKEFLEEARVQVRRKTATHRSVQRSHLALLVHEHPDWNQERLGQLVGLSGRQVHRVAVVTRTVRAITNLVGLFSGTAGPSSKPCSTATTPRRNKMG